MENIKIIQVGGMVFLHDISRDVIVNLEMIQNVESYNNYQVKLTMQNGLYGFLSCTFSEFIQILSVCNQKVLEKNKGDLFGMFNLNENVVANYNEKDPQPC